MFVACVHFIWSQAQPAVEGQKQDSAALLN
jgi:hypothetical protein